MLLNHHSLFVLFQLREVIESNAPDALQAYFGNSSAASNLSKNLQQLPIIYEDMHRILAASDRTSAAESLDVKSAKGDEASNGRPPSTTHTEPPKLSTVSEAENTHSEVVKMEAIDDESSNSQASVPPSSSASTNDKKKAADVVFLDE